MAADAREVAAGPEGTAVRKSHRAAHWKVVLVCAVLAGGFFRYGWSERATRPVPQPLPAEAPTSDPAVWDVALETPAGTARAALVTDPTGVQLMRVSLPRGLDAAEPGLLLEVDGAPPRILGSVSAGRPAIPVPEGLPGGGRLVLVDLARDIRLGEAMVPGDGT